MCFKYIHSAAGTPEMRVSALILLATPGKCR